jgi:hypothetical protein
MSTLGAATELLIRTGFAGNGRPWVRFDELARRSWIAFDEIPDLIGGMSGGERRLLLLPHRSTEQHPSFSETR